MVDRPNVKLSRLREIGWGRWDPIGLNELDDRPEDEYDGYLLTAAGRLWRGETEAQVADYLADIETEHMGLGPGVGVKERAARVARDIAKYVSELRA